MAKRANGSNKITPTFVCHYVVNRRTLCGASKDLHDTESRYEFQTHASACPSCRGRLASIDAVEESARALSSAGFPVEGEALRAVRTGNIDAALMFARTTIERVDRVAAMNAIDGVKPRWYDDARNAAAGFRSAVMSLA